MLAPMTATALLADVNLAWYTARAAGLVSWFLLAASITWGVLLHTRIFGRRPRPKWVLDLHRFLGGLSVVFVGVHLAGLLADSYVHFGPAELLVPFTSSYRPGAVAWGIAAFYVLIAVELTSLAMRWLPKRLWHGVHLGSYALFAMATVHLFTAGTDSGNLLIRITAAAVVIESIAFVAVRVLEARRPKPARPSRPRPQPHPVAPGSDRTPTAPTAPTHAWPVDAQAMPVEPPYVRPEPEPVHAALR
jgi:hypothetical protein